MRAGAARSKEDSALITYAPHSWYRRVLFLALQVLEFHTHRTAHDRVAAPLWPLAAYIPSLSFSQSLSPDLPLTFSHSPRRRNPLLFYIARPVFVSFCRPFLLSRALCLFTAYYIYICAFERSICARQLFTRANFEPGLLRAPRRKERRGSDESGQTAREQNDSREKNETMKGLKLIQLNEKRRRVGTGLIYFRSHPFAPAPR